MVSIKSIQQNNPKKLKNTQVFGNVNNEDQLVQQIICEQGLEKYLNFFFLKFLSTTTKQILHNEVYWRFTKNINISYAVFMIFFISII